MFYFASYGPQNNITRSCVVAHEVKSLWQSGVKQAQVNVAKKFNLITNKQFQDDDTNLDAE
jgi:hypothetical protein